MLDGEVTKKLRQSNEVNDSDSDVGDFIQHTDMPTTPELRGKSAEL